MAYKRSKNIINPFVYEGYKGAEFFCNRIEESQKLIANFKNGVNTTIVSPRRIGKTVPIKHVFNQIKCDEKDAVCIY